MDCEGDCWCELLPHWKVRRTGFNAQEVQAAAEEAKYDFSGIGIPQNGVDHYSLSYESFVVPLVKAVQEQQRIIEQQRTLLEKLQEAYESELRLQKSTKDELKGENIQIRRELKTLRIK